MVSQQAVLSVSTSGCEFLLLGMLLAGSLCSKICCTGVLLAEHLLRHASLQHAYVDLLHPRQICCNLTVTQS